MHKIERGSGATISYPCVLKTGKGVVDQARYMKKAPAVFAGVQSFGVADNGEEFMVMPQYTPLQYALNQEEPLVRAVEKLKILWHKTLNTRRSITRGQYMNYVAKCEAPQRIRDLCLDFFIATAATPGTLVSNVHGDATVQNIVLSEKDAFWIDPNPRPVPLEAELDIGKLAQSLAGYDFIRDPADRYLAEFVGRSNKPLVQFYLATHIARLWKYQPNQRDWAEATMDKLEKGGLDACL